MKSIQSSQRLTVSLIFLQLLFGANLAFSQWIESSFQPVDLINGVDFPDVNAAYLTGSNGIVYKSNDAGISWNNIYEFGPFSNLEDPNFINADTGFVSANSQVYRTVDGGITWTPIDFGGSQQFGFPLRRIKITNERIYSSYTRSDTSIFVKSDDLGVNWDTILQRIEPNAKSFVYSFFDVLNGKVINQNELERVYRTNDGGLTFDTLVITNGPMVPQIEYDLVTLQSAFHYGSHGSQSYPTRTWNTGTFYFPVDLDGFGVLPIYDLDYNTSRLYASSLYGKVFYSLNNGQFWFEQQTTLNAPLYGIAFFDDNKGIAVSGQKVVYTSNGGFLNTKELSGLDQSIQVFPNPASTYFEIKSGPVKIKKLVISNVLGEIVFEKKNPKIKIDVEKMVPGMYYLQLETAKGTIVKELVIGD